MKKNNSEIFMSVIMPVYNGEKWLSETIESILNQTHKNFEFIIINDCSTDNSQEILEEYEKKDSRIKIFKTTYNCGNPGGPAALAVEKCSKKSKYIATTDQDDLSVKNRFEIQIEFMEKNPHVDICGGWQKMFKSKHRVCKSPSKDSKIKVKLFTGCCMSHPTVMFRKEFLDKNKINYVDEMCQDYKLWSTCAIEHNATFANIRKILLMYRVHETQTSYKNPKLIKESNYVREYQLKKLGFKNKKEIENFILWRRYNIKPTKDNLIVRRELLKKALKLNEKNNIYPRKEFRKRLSYLYKKDLLKGKQLGMFIKAIIKGL